LPYIVSHGVIAITWRELTTLYLGKDYLFETNTLSGLFVDPSSSRNPVKSQKNHSWILRDKGIIAVVLFSFYLC
jgi:hypothetical protein